MQDALREIRDYDINDNNDQAVVVNDTKKDDDDYDGGDDRNGNKIDGNDNNLVIVEIPEKNLQ